MKEELYNQFIGIGRKTLPVLLKPQPDELLSSWIMRYSREFLTKSHTFCKFILETENVWNRDIDLNVSDDFLQELSSKTFLKWETVYNTTLRSYYPNLFVHTIRKWIVPIRVYHRTRKNAGLMLCPGCLKKDVTPYFRKKWRLSFSVVCPDCEVILIERCPKCNSPISFHRLEVGLKEAILNKDICICYKCSFDFRKAKASKADKSIVKFQKHLYSILDKGFSAEIQYSHLYFDGIYQLARIIGSPVEKLKDFDKELSKCSGLQFKSKRTRGEFDKMAIDDRLLIMSKISWLFEEWPRRFLNISASTRTYSSYLLRDMRNPPYWYWKLVMQNTYVVHTAWRANDLKYSNLSSYTTLGKKRLSESISS